MSKDHNLHLIIRNTRSDDIEKIVKLQKESFPILARYGNIWHPDELRSHLLVFPLGQFVAVEEDGEVAGSASTLIVTLNQNMPSIRGRESPQTVCLPTIILMEIACMEQIYQRTRNLDTKALGVCSMREKGISSKIRLEKNDQWREII
jgi:hypothetical protein